MLSVDERLARRSVVAGEHVLWVSRDNVLPRLNVEG